MIRTIRHTRFILTALLLGAIATTGCHRPFYRSKADKESSAVIDQTPMDSAWELQNYYVYPHPQSRFASASNPDFPPMPPDDPAAYDSAPNPQKPGKPGIALEEGSGYRSLLAYWNRENREKLAILEKEKQNQVGQPNTSASPKSAAHVDSTRENALTVVIYETPGGADSEKAVTPEAQVAIPRALEKTESANVRLRPVPSDPSIDHSVTISEVGKEDNAQGTSVTISEVGDNAQGPSVTISEPKGHTEAQHYPQDPGEEKDSRSKEQYPDPFRYTSETEPFLLNLNQALELALINSREFQDRREDLYLTSLPVTVERFAFSTQLFATEQIVREYTGRLTGEGQRNRWIFNTGTGFTKLFSTGALLLFQFANRTVVELIGNFDPKTISTSTINLDLIQPLLRGGGKAVTLEPLTLVERNLLYEVRDFARFRKQFYVGIAAGSGGGGINIGATRFRNRPATFSSGGSIAGAIISASRGGISSLPASTVGGIGTSGYLDTLLSASLLTNQRRNVRALEGTLQYYQDLFEGEGITQLQVQQVEQQLLSGRNDLFNAERNLLDNLDQFKVQLGLPVTIALELDDGLLRPQIEQLDQFEVMLTVQDLGRQAEAAGKELPPDAIRQRLVEIATTSPLVQGLPFQEEFRAGMAKWDRKLLTDAELRQQLLDLDKELNKQQAVIDDLQRRGLPTEALVQAFLRKRFEQDLGFLENALRTFEKEGTPARKFAGELAVIGATPAGPLTSLTGLALLENQRRKRALLYRTVLNTFVLVLEEARNERLLLARGSWPTLPKLLIDDEDLLKVDFDRAQEMVARTSLTHRLDLMNSRAQLVDSWRQIRIAANSLLGVFNVEYHLRSETPPGLAQPFAFSGSRTRHQLTFNLELPLVRILERNNYRASLIAWQRNRRQFMLTQDSVVAGVRSQIRQLRVLAVNYEIQKKAVELAYLNVENSRAALLEPLPPGQTRSASAAAALTTQLLNNQAQLISRQNQLITLWVNYLSTRMQLYRDLGTMQINSRGAWIDDFTVEQPSRKSSQQVGEHPK